MQVRKIEENHRRGAGHFLIWVFSDVVIYWRRRPCLFQYDSEDQTVYFVIVGGKEKRRLAGKADNKEEAIAVAIEYLEWWLKECRAIGNLERYSRLKIESDDARGPGYFTFQVWAVDKEKQERRDTLFSFLYENRQLYFVGEGDEDRKELVMFRDGKTQEEWTVAPGDKEAAIKDAIDYLEWRLSEEGRV